MAERRMFAKSIIDSDAFLDMPLSTQCLYFHLAMRADDDGFLNNVNRIMRTINATKDDYNILLIRKFIIQFDDGICVVKHWRIHNYIQNDRYRETNYKSHKELLSLDDNKAYTLEETGKKLVGNKIVKAIEEKKECIQDVYKTEPQDRLGKDRLGKDSIDKNNIAKEKPMLFSLYEQLGFGTINQVVLTDMDVLCKQYSNVWLAEAFKEANDQGIRNMKYVKGILKNWKTNGFKAEKPKKNYSKKESGTGFNNFEPRQYDYDSLEKKLLGWDDDNE